MRTFALLSLSSAFLLSSLACDLSFPDAQGQEKVATEEPGSAVRGSIVEDRAAKKLLEAGDARLDASESTKAIEVWKSVIERYPRSRYRFDAQL